MGRMAVFGFLTLLLFISVLSGCAEKEMLTQQTENTKPIVVGVLFADLQTGRWQTDRDLIVSELERLGGSAIVASADMDADRQFTQAKSMILQGVDVLIVVAQDGEKAAEIVNEAHKSGIKVIAYDRLIKNSDLDYYLTFDNIKVGESEARGVVDAMNGKGNIVYIGGSPTDNNAFLVRDGSFKVLQPKIDSGDINVTMDVFIDSWNQRLAYEKMIEYLKTKKTVNGVVVANDGMAAGVIQALEEYGLAGKVPVSGQDAELNACKFILQGKQTVTVYKPIKMLAFEAAKTAMTIANKQEVAATETVNNGKIDVPSILLDVVTVDKQNINDTVIKDGFYTLEDVYGAAK